MIKRLLLLFIGIMIILNGATRIPQSIVEGSIVIFLGIVFVLTTMHRDSETVLDEE